MLPLGIVLDTNHIVSAALKPNGLQHRVLQMALTKPARLYLSEELLFEYDDVLRRAELLIAKGVRVQLLQVLRNCGH